MRAWIDTEFNEFGGDLISMAIVAEDGREFYEVTHCANPAPWIAENVIPVLNKNPISIHNMRLALSEFFMPYKNLHVIADYPDDISYFCKLLIVGAGQLINTPFLTMEITDIKFKSAIPHNALEDAKAIRNSYIGK